MLPRLTLCRRSSTRQPTAGGRLRVNTMPAVVWLTIDRRRSIACFLESKNAAYRFETLKPMPAVVCVSNDRRRPSTLQLTAGGRLHANTMPAISTRLAQINLSRDSKRQTAHPERTCNHRKVTAFSFPTAYRPTKMTLLVPRNNRTFSMTALPFSGTSNRLPI